MIARISSGDSVAGAINYNSEKVMEGEASVLAYCNFEHCLSGYKTVTDSNDPYQIPGQKLNNIDTQDLIHLSPEFSAFLMQIQCNENSRIKNNVFSCSLNLNSEDLENIQDKAQLNGCANEDELYRKIADRYMEGMGYGNQPYVVFKHDDIERTHIHIVSIRVDEKGKKIEDFQENRKSEKVRADINESFGLSTEGETKKGDKLDISRQVEKRYDYINRMVLRISDASKPEALAVGNSHLKHNISNVLKYVDENYHPKNLGEYNKVLSQFNVVCKLCTKGEDKAGKGYSGCQFAVINDKGVAESHLIKGSAFGKKFSYAGLEQKFAINSGSFNIKTKSDNSKDYIRATIDAYIKSPAKVDFGGLVQHLNEKGVKTDITMDKDDPTMVKGISFIDNLNGHTFNGSQLGKAYSYQRICDFIDSHNADVDKYSAKGDVYIPKELFDQSQKIIKKQFDSLYKQKQSHFPLESSLTRELAQMDREQRNNFLLLNKADSLGLSNEQWGKAADFFIKMKVRSLAEQEFKEDSMYTKRVVDAVRFAQQLPLEQDKSNFLIRAGVHVSNTNGLTFLSEKNSNVMLSLDEVCNLSKDSVTPVLNDKPLFKDLGRIPDPDYDLPPLSKHEREFVNAFINREDKMIKGDFSKVATLLDADGQKLSAKMYALTEDDIRLFGRVKTSIVREEKVFPSDISTHFEDYRLRFRAAAYDNSHDDFKADACVDAYNAFLQYDLLNQIERERQLAYERMVAAALYARKIDKPSDKAEFLKRMGVYAEIKNGELSLVWDGKSDYRLTWSQLVQRDPRLSVEDNLFHQSVPMPTNPDARVFSKKERDFVNTCNNSSWLKDLPDSRYSSASKYLNEAEKAQVARLGNGARITEILGRNPDATILNTVKALWTRGYVVKPVQDGGKTIFKAGMHDAKDDTYIALPYSIQQRLHNTHYIDSYPSINELVLNGKWNSPKMQTLKDITRAADYNDVDLLVARIDKVAETNKILASAMREAMGDSQIPDYERVANLVFNYQGEHTIILPPPTLKVNSFVQNQDVPSSNQSVKDTGYKDMLEAMRNGASLEYLEQKAMERIQQRQFKDYTNDDDNTPSKSKGIY